MIDPRVPFLKLQMTQVTSSSPPSSPSTSPSMVELREYFECPICLSVPRAPPIFQVQRCTLPLMPMKFHRIVFQCLSGHLICSECRPQINVCPICRASLGSNRQVITKDISVPFLTSSFIDNKIRRALPSGFLSPSTAVGWCSPSGCWRSASRCRAATPTPAAPRSS